MRTDPHAIHERAARAHPEWVAVDAKGQPYAHWAAPGQWVSCALGDYNFQFMTEVHREIMRLYRVDGIFSNRWSGHGTCYCDTCKKNFRDFSGLDLPAANDPRDPARKQYIVWHQKRLFEIWRLWDAEIKKINPNAAFLANSGGGALSALDMKTVGELAPTLAADRQARRGLTPPWANGKNGKEYRATMGRKAIAGIASVGLEEPYRWKDSVQHGDEIRLWIAEGVANGMRPWVTKFNAKPYDPRWMKPVEDFYKWHHANERYLRNEEPLASVAMVYSQQTAHFYGGQNARGKVEDHTLGFYQAMIESRIPFEMVHDGLLDAEHVDRYRTLILPNIAALSGAQCNQLRGYVQRGGSIVATHETSLYDESGMRRKDFGLADLFGASYAGATEAPVQNSYLNIEKDPRTGRFHPLLTGLEDAPRIINGAQQVHVRPSSKPSYSPLTQVPSYPDLPMEEVYPRTARTDIPGVYLSGHGRGRVVYFPFDLDRTFWEVLSPDHLKLLRNAVLWATNEKAPITVTGPGVLDVTLWRQKNSLTAHLVNLTNPMMMKGPVREIIPLSAQTVGIRMPGGAKAKAVRLLVSDTVVQFVDRNGTLELTVPSIGLHEVIAIDL